MLKRSCPLVKREPLVGVYQLDFSNRRRTCLPVTLEWHGGALKTSALLDSGAEEGFLDATVAAQGGVPLVEVSKPLVAAAGTHHPCHWTSQDEALGKSPGRNLPPDYRHPALPGGVGPPLDGKAPAPRWTGPGTRSLSGICRALAGVCIRPTPQWLLLSGRRLQTWRRFRGSTTTLGRSFARAVLLACRRTDHTIVRSSSSREQLPRGDASSPCPVQRGRPWKSTSPSPWQQGSFDRHLPRPVQGSSSSGIRTAP